MIHHKNSAKRHADKAAALDFFAGLEHLGCVQKVLRAHDAKIITTVFLEARASAMRVAGEL